MIRKWPALAAFAVASALLIGLGCSRPGQNADEPDDVPPIDVPPEDLKALIEGNNQFAIDLYKQVAAKTDGNIILSPYSISSALAMTYAGARGQTAEEMRKVLHFTLPDEKLHAAFGGMTRWLQAVGNRKKSELSIANALWAQRGLGFVPEFLDLTNKSYGAGLREVDFAGNPEAARGTINRWVEEQTRDRIKELLLPQDTPEKTRLVLTNAIYFKGQWQLPFDPANTKAGDFKTTSGQVVKVPMMHLNRVKMRYGTGDELSSLCMPYAGNQFEMVFLLPSRNWNLRGVEGGLTSGGVQRLIDGLTEGKLDVSVPRFRFRSRLEFKSELSQLGMPIAFLDAADFGGITGGAELKIRDVIHGGNVEVDEEGTTAAAATAVVMEARSSSTAFRLDRAFLFLIRDMQTGAILFLGRVDNPSKP
jgi:serpin B